MEEAYAAESRVPQILAGSLIPFGLVTVVVLARFYTRGVLTRNWRGDDNWVLVSWILGITLMVLHCLLTKYGTGHHQSTISAENLETIYMLAFAIQIIYQIVLGTTKIGICTLFLCVFQDNTGRRIMYGTVAFIAVYTTALTFASVFQCNPISRAWKQNSPGSCINFLGPLCANGICNIAVDALLMIFIFPRILKLNIHRRQKIALLVVLSFSLLAVVAAVVRIIGIIRFHSSNDAVWDGSHATTWSALEVTTGLLCASAPTLRPLFRRIGGVFSSTITQSTSASHTRKRNPEGASHIVGGLWVNEDEERGQKVGTSIESTTELVSFPSPAKQSSQIRQEQEY